MIKKTHEKVVGTYCGPFRDLTGGAAQLFGDQLTVAVWRVMRSPRKADTCPVALWQTQSLRLCDYARVENVTRFL